MKKDCDFDIVLGLFDGISCGRQALDRVKAKYKHYVSVELASEPKEIARYNYPNSKYLSDVLSWRSWKNIPWDRIDLVIAGFPCQPWSNAGNKGGVEDPRGEIVYEMIHLIEHIRLHNPNVKIMLENVDMAKDFTAFLTNLFNERLGIEHITKINSAEFSAQARVRNYWTNFPVSSEIVPYTPATECLVDVLDHSVSEDSNLFLSEGHSDYLLAIASLPNKERKAIYEKFLKGSDKSDKKEIFDNGTGLPKVEFILPEYGDFIQLQHLGQNGTIFSKKAKTMTTSGYLAVVVSKNNKPWVRKLSLVEYARLQGVNTEFIVNVPNVSETAKQEALGNGWNVETVAYIFKNLLKDIRE